MKKQFIYLLIGLLGFICLGAVTSYQVIQTDATLTGDGYDTPLGISTTNKSTIGDVGIDADGNIIYVDDASGLAYYDNTSHNGKFGINTSSPTVALDCNGTTRSTMFQTAGNGQGIECFSDSYGDLYAKLSKDSDNGGQLLLYNGDLSHSGKLTGKATSDGIAVIGDFYASGVAQIEGYGAGAATFDASGNITSVSDIRLKNVEHSYNVGLNEILKVNPIVYKWNDKSGMEQEHEYAGFSAQNVNAALGDLATGQNKDGYMSLQDRAILGALVNSIHELNDKIEAQAKEIKRLKHK